MIVESLIKNVLNDKPTSRMFSHLCRACLMEFKDPSDIVPLFEPYENVFYYRLCNELQLSVRIDSLSEANVIKSPVA